MVFKRAMYQDYALAEKKTLENSPQAKRNEKGLKLDELAEEEFTGKVSVLNWAISRA